MQNISESYLLEIKKPSRSFECRITIGDNIYTNSDIINITIEDVQPNDGFNIGTAVSKSLELTLSTDNVIYSTSVIKVEIGLLVGSTIEYVLMGYFNIDDIEKTDYSIKLTCYDNMMKFEKPYFSNLGETSSLQNIVNELAEITGVEFKGSLPSYNLNKLEGFTCREILGYVASLCAGNAYITREGKFTISTPKSIDYSITDENYINLKTEEDIYIIGSVTCKANETELTKGTLTSSTMEVTFENPWVNDSILTDIYNKLRGFEYVGYSMKWQGDLTLDVGDIISLTDNKGIKRNIPILSQKLSYNGGLTSEIGAKGESKNKNEFSSTGNLNNKVNRVVTELLLVNKALINKADISQLNAVSATIGTIEAKVGKIDTLINGNLTSDNIHSLILTSSKVTVENGFIKNAMIENVDVSKVNAGDISTNKFRIISDSGKMLIEDNTIQIRDNNRVRVQIGKDASNDYSMYIWDSSGKLMFDATGLKADGIKNKIIRDDMISDNANIDGGKLNISSVVTSINNGTTTIKGSKIYLDEKSQTLNVAFNSMSNTVNDHTSTIGSHTTSIGVMQGQITGLISDTTIVEDGTSKKIKDVYTSLKATVNGISSKVSSVESSFNNMQIGGRNLIIRHNELKDKMIGMDGSVGNQTLSSLMLDFIKVTPGETLLFSQIENTGGNSYFRYAFYAENKTTVIKRTPNNAMKFKEIVPSGAYWLRVSYDSNNKVKLERGTKYTDWSPAPEDVDSSINAVDTRVTALDVTVKSTSSKVSSIEQNMESITQRVSSTETKVTTITNTANTANSNATNALNTANTANSKIDGLQIGGRNLITGSSKTLQDIKIAKYSGAIGRWSRKHCSEYGLKVGDTITFSIEINAVNKSKLGARIDFYSESSGDAGKTSKANSKSIVTKGNTKIVYVTATIPEGKEYIQLFIHNHNASVDTTTTTEKYRYDKLEIGNKATSWSPAPEDVQSQIDANKTEISSTKSKVSSIETNLSSITSRVSTVEQNQTSVSGKVTSLETWKKSAESKLTKEGLTTIISNHYTTSNDVNGIISSKGYMTQTQVQQTVNGLEVKIQESGGYNLLLNGKPNKDTLQGWHSREYNLEGANLWRTFTIKNDEWTGYEPALELRVQDMTSGEYRMSQYIETTPGQSYIFTGYIAGHRCDKVIYIRSDANDEWTITKSVEYDNMIMGGGNADDYSGWARIEIPFTANRNTTMIEILIRNGYQQGCLWAKKLMVTPGTTVKPWSANPNEVYSGITAIDKDGIKVQHESGAFSRFDVREMYQSNENGDRTISIRNGGLRTYQFRNEGNGASAFLGGISSTRNNGSDRVYGNSIFGSNSCGYVDIGFSESGEDNQHQNIIPWLRCTHYDGNTGVPQGIHTYKNLHVRNWSYFYYRPSMYYGIKFPYENRDDLNVEVSYITTNANPSPGNRRIVVCGADGAVLMVQNGEEKIGHQVLEEGSQVGLFHQAWGNWDFNGWNLYNARVTYSLSNPIAKLSSKERKFTRESEAIMSTTKLIQDRGEDFTMDGQCIVEIPDDIKYNIGRYDINIVKYGRGDIWVSERTLDYFVVESDNDIKFTWVLEGELLENAYRAATYNKLYNFEEVEENPMSTDNIIETIPASKYATFDDELIQKMLRV